MCRLVATALEAESRLTCGRAQLEETRALTARNFDCTIEIGGRGIDVVTFGMFVIAEFGAELPGSGIILGQFRSDVASCRDQGAAQFDSRHQFARIALGACRQQPKEFDDAIVMAYRLAIG